MKKLTFAGFLDGYVRELSGLQRIDLAKMAVLADETMPRLKEPVVVYATLKRSPDTIRKLFFGTSLLNDYESYFSDANQLTETSMMMLPEGYQKLYHSYLAVKNKNLNEQRIKGLYRARILEIRSSSKITDYRVCKELSINHGNYHAFLKQGKLDCLSLVKVRQVYDLVRAR